MHTFLRHASTGQCFEYLDRWTPDRDRAHDFGLVAKAVKFAQKMQLPNLELILSFDDPHQVTAMSFGKFRRRVLRGKTA